MAEDLFLAAIAHDLGEARDLEVLRDATNGDLLATLAANGLRAFRESARDSAEMAARSVAGTFSAWGGDPGTIDLVISCTQSSGQKTSPGVDLYAYCEGVDLSRVPKINLNMGGCANLIPAMRVARGLLQTERLRNILVVTADRCASREGRLRESDIAVFSDGAASCILSQALDHAQFRIHGVGQSTNSRVAELDYASQRPRILMLIAAGIRGAFRAAMADAGLTDGDIEHLVTSTVRRDTVRLIAQQCRVDAGQAFTGTLAGVSHAYSADLLINLREGAGWRSQAGLVSGKPFLAMALSRTAWGGLVISAL